MADNGEVDMPRDGKIVKELLRSMNVEDYEPQVVNQFLELWYRYIADVLTDAHTYSEHAEKSAIDSDDIKLAIQSKVNFSFSQPPPRELVPEDISERILLYTNFCPLFLGKMDENTPTCPACESLDEEGDSCPFCRDCGPKCHQVLLELARSRNKVPLPKSISGPGLRLPPDQDTLISPNYQLAIPKRQISHPDEETEEDEEAPIPPNPDQNTSQNQGETSRGTPQRVSFPLIAKDPR